mgnify:CR=1 FL=1
MNGYCCCGCGGKTALARENTPKMGWVKGQPVKFISGHNAKRNTYTVNENGCWIWNGKPASTGYGKTWVKGKTVNAHRYMFEKTKGQIPAGFQLDHLCRIPLCVNPSHLEIVTPAENTRRGLLPKLTRDIVVQIKARLLTAERGDQVKIAHDFGISDQHVSQIKSGRHWKDVA